MNRRDLFKFSSAATVGGAVIKAAPALPVARPLEPGSRIIPLGPEPVHVIAELQNMLRAHAEDAVKTFEAMTKFPRFVAPSVRNANAGDSVAVLTRDLEGFTPTDGRRLARYTSLAGILLIPLSHHFEATIRVDDGLGSWMTRPAVNISAIALAESASKISKEATVFQPARLREFDRGSGALSAVADGKLTSVRAIYHFDPVRLALLLTFDVLFGAI